MGYDPRDPFDARNAPLVFSMLGDGNGPRGGGSGSGCAALGCAALLFFALVAVMLLVGFHG